MDEDRACRGKQVYLTKAEAKGVSRFMAGRHREAFNQYRCEGCGYWHVGHLVPEVFRARPVATFERPVRFG
jgi:hypothetical protein